ncbi:MAG: HNH endonuclease [Pyrinomonadaceae bacterium]|nr:HNH endonuclease [Pyrinomonadaceae bacterium]
MNAFYPEVAERANHLCEYCHAPELAFNFLFEVEHITPISLGGETVLENLALACRSCNIFKSNFTVGINERLFNPRQDAWNEHLSVNLMTFEIVGLTEIGQGTITRLRLNSDLQLSARHQWHRLDLFP